MPRKTVIPCHSIEMYRLVYVEVPKAGCTSVKYALAPYKKGYPWRSDDFEAMHRWFGYQHAAGLEDLARRFANRWRDYQKFTVVRHPIRRFESLYYQKIDPHGRRDINDFVAHLGDDNHWLWDTHGISQVSLIGTDLSQYDFVGRTEDMPEVERYLCRVLDDVQIPHLFRSSRTREPLSQQTIDRLYAIYREDFDVLGYRP